MRDQEEKGGDRRGGVSSRGDVVDEGRMRKDAVWAAKCEQSTGWGGGPQGHQTLTLDTVCVILQADRVLQRW